MTYLSKELNVKPEKTTGKVEFIESKDYDKNITKATVRGGVPAGDTLSITPTKAKTVIAPTVGTTVEGGVIPTLGAYTNSLFISLGMGARS